MESISEKSATIYLVRHGETIGNIHKIILHPDEDILSDIGKNQAKLLGNALKDIHFTKVYTSQYPRTKETAGIILKENNKNQTPDIKVDPRLQEIGFPNSYGKPYKYALSSILSFLESGKPFDEFLMDESESIPDIRIRAKSYISNLIQDVFGQKEPETILIVSHGAFMRITMECLSEMKEAVASTWDPSGNRIARNTSYMKLSMIGKSREDLEIKFQKFHETSHLSKEMLETDSLTRLAQTPEGQALSGCFQV